MTEKNFVLTRDGPVATLTLNRPAQLNSLSLQAIKDILVQVRELATDETVYALIITGAGRGFCAGWQLDGTEVPGLPDESFGVRQGHLMEEYFNPLIKALDDLPMPIVAAVNGVCAGAGVSIALAADIALAAKSASFILTFAPKLGLVPDLGATWKLPRLIGWARAQAVTLLGDRITSEQALEWGMIWQMIEDGGLMQRAAEIARRLAGGPPRIALEVRHAYHASQHNDLSAQMDYERHRQRYLLDSPAFAEGVAAFAEKRPPQFRKVL